jgi:surface polysaccharide O-acyltransferase-like enzyme
MTLKRIETFDFVKFFAIFFVVCIHTLPFTTYKFGELDGENIGFIINAFARFSVPYFFMVSGYLLEKKLKQSDTKTNYIYSYLLKNIKIFISWSLFFFFYDIVLVALKAFLQGLTIKSEIIHYVETVFRVQNLYYGINVGTSYHLWFLLSLIWANVILAIFIKMNKVRLLLGISLLLHVIGLFGQSYSTLVKMPLDTRDALFFGLFYITTGYYLSTLPLNSKLKPKLWLILFFFLSLLQIAEGEIVTNHAKGYWGNYYLFTILTAITLLVFSLTKKQIYLPFINKIGANSLGIYVIHPLFISLSYIVLNILHLKIITQTFIWNLLFTPFIFLISYYSYNLLQILKSKVRFFPSK